MKNEQLIVSVLVANQPGALIRVTSLFAKRGINISSLHVAQLNNPETSRITLVTDSGAEEKEQIERQLNKIFDVEKVELVETDSAIARKGFMLRENADAHAAGPQIPKGLSKGTLLVEVTGDSKNLNAFVDYLRPYGMIEMVTNGQNN